MSTKHRLALASGIALAVPLLIAGCTSTATPVGTWGSTAEGEPHLVINEDGTLGGNDGCNVMFGNWTSDADGLVFSEVGGTLMFCEGVDTWLSQLQTATVQGNELHVLGEGGEELGTLTKQ